VFDRNLCLKIVCVKTYKKNECLQDIRKRMTDNVTRALATSVLWQIIVQGFILKFSILPRIIKYLIQNTGIGSVSTNVMAFLPDKGAAIGPYLGLLVINNGTAIFLISWAFISQFREGLKKAWKKKFKNKVGITVEMAAYSTMARQN